MRKNFFFHLETCHVISAESPGYTLNSINHGVYIRRIHSLFIQRAMSIAGEFHSFKIQDTPIRVFFLVTALSVFPLLKWIKLFFHIERSDFSYTNRWIQLAFINYSSNSFLSRWFFLHPSLRIARLFLDSGAIKQTVIRHICFKLAHP